MDIIKLQCFKTAAKYESITKASAELFIPQPTISKQIRRLEEELGYALFNRSGKNIYLNENGKIFLKYAKKIDSFMIDCNKEIRDHNQHSERFVSLLLSSCSKIFVDILVQFRKLNPDIRLYVNQSEYNDSEADLKIFSTNEDLNSEACVKLLCEDICLAVPLNSPLAFHKNVSIQDLQKERFIMLKAESDLRKVVDPFFHKHGFQPNIIMELENPSLLREFISLNFGVSLMPAVTWGNASKMQIKLIPLENDGLYRNIFLSWNSERYLSPYVHRLINFIENYFEQFVSSSTDKNQKI